MRQITSPRGNFIEKVLRDAEGRLVRATFCVYENGGRVKARLVSVVYVKEKSIGNKVLFLNSLKAEKTFGSEIIFESKIISPYFDSNILYSSGSKPRAPTF